ncbi:ion channel [Phycicoccus ginsengisoli]
MRAWVETVKGHPSGVLLAAQLVAVLAYPFFGDNPGGRTAIGVFGVLVMLVALYAVRATPALTWVAVVIGAPVVALTVAEGFAPDNDAVRLWSALLHAAFYAYTAYGLIRYLFDDSWVTRDEIFAVGANFTVVSWMFAYVYMALQVLSPGSFVAYQGEGTRTFLELLYLSFANLTSVGLSDVVAVLPHARAVVILEQVAGVMYVALLIARVVGLTVMRRRT